MTASIHVLVMAGGTGGHIFPALAVADELRAQGCQVTWLGSRGGMEARLVPQHDFPIRYVDVQGLRGQGLLRWLLAPLKLLYAVSQSLWICLQLKPNVVLGMGGFASGPGGLASWLLRRPLVIHEQNAAAGLTNRLLAKFASKVLEAFPGSLPNAVLTGNPIRKRIAELAVPQQRFQQRDERLRILVLGGSQGAAVLNETLPKALASISQSIVFQVRHQCGEKHLAVTQAAYREANVEGQVDSFIDDMAEAYAWADLVICRAGALTIAELAAAGVAAVLIPFPFAVDDHQTKNARWLADTGAAILLPQVDCSVEQLANTLRELLKSGRETLLIMANKARQMARPDATAQVAGYCLEVAHG